MTALLHYFAYGSNMNPARLAGRGVRAIAACGGWLAGVQLVFDKWSATHPSSGHANLAFDRGGRVEGVLYLLADEREIGKLDPYEHTPVNYSREVVRVESTQSGVVSAWTYFANPRVRRAGLRPERRYLAHLLAGRPFLSAGYFARLVATPCIEDLASPGPSARMGRSKSSMADLIADGRAHLSPSAPIAPG